MDSVEFINTLAREQEDVLEQCIGEKYESIKELYDIIKTLTTENDGFLGIDTGYIEEDILNVPVIFENSVKAEEFIDNALLCSELDLKILQGEEDKVVCRI